MPDDHRSFRDFFLRDDQWRCKPDDMVMCRLCQEAVIFQGQADIPGCFSVFGSYHYSIKQAFTPDGFYHI